MQFRIAATFTDSLARLTGDEQKIVKTTAFDLQLNPANPGMQFHRLDKVKDKHFWSIRVNKDVRIIAHRSETSLLLCFVDHHDRAYAWAERRKLEAHPTTGAAQFVEVRERVQEVVIPAFVPAPATESKPTLPRCLFEHLDDETLLGYGVPLEWLPDVRQATEDSLLHLADRLPAEAAEALLELATGGKPAPRPVVEAARAFDHPDAQRRFRVMTNVEELERALEYPWDQWSVFLHPDQRQLVERSFAGPARVSGSAGTGKTIVALHRAVFLARSNPDARVLLTTFSDILANALRTRLRRLIGNEPRLGERLEVHSLEAIGARLYKSHCGPLSITPRAIVQEALQKAASKVEGQKFTPAFLLAEWEQVVDAWQLDTWESYRDIARLGRKTRLPESQRRLLWSIFQLVRDDLASRNQITTSEMFTRLAGRLRQSAKPPFQFVVVDEAQDIGVGHLRFLAALAGGRENGLFFAGDLGQRIFQQPFSWLALDVDVRGRSRTLRVNYRTSHQIRSQADRLLGSEVSDADGNTEDRSHTVSVFNGPPPAIRVLESTEAETEHVRQWIEERVSEGVLPHEIGIFVRSDAQLERGHSALKAAGLPYRALDESMELSSGYAVLSTMHLAKGLEFRCVAVMACDDEVVPLQARIESVGDDADLEEVYNTERHLLYVACTRARDHLLVTAVEPASEFLEDMHL
jgi:mRNA-degrading endonuclease RelE of RelBE toxin-antitoxin system